MSQLVTPFRVGVFVIGMAAIFFGIYSYVHKGGLSHSEAIEVFAIFHDASGLEKKALVEIAGINVGEIKSIELAEGNLAKVVLRIKRTVHLRADAAVTKRSASLLGDNLLEIAAGSPESPPMAEGGQILTVNDRNNMQELFDSVGRITKQVESVTKTIAEVVNDQQKPLAGMIHDVSEMIEKAGSTLNSTLDDVKAITGGLRGDLVGGGRDNLGEIVQNVRVATQEAASALKSVDQIIGANQNGLSTDVQSVKEALDKVNRTLQNLQDVTGKVASGEGTVGKLISDDGIYRKLDDTLGDANDFLGRIFRIQTEFSLRADYLLSEANAKGYFDLKLITRPDRYYRLGLVQDTRGTTSQTFNTCNPCVPGYQTTQLVTSTTRAVKWNAEIAQRWYLATLRGGILENTAGAGLDLDLWKPYLTLSNDIFDFADAFQPYPRWRSYLTGRFFSHIELRAGVDDILNRPASVNDVAPQARGTSLGGRDFFFGGGLFFTDEDIKSVIGLAATAK